MTFHSLYRLEQRGLLDCPIVGVAVDDWTIDQLVERARTSIEGTGETLDPKVFDRFAAGSPTSGRLRRRRDLRARRRRRSAARERPVFYLEIPPFLFGTVVKGLAEAGLTKDARVVVEKPFGHDLESARALAEELHQYIDESQLLRIDHYLGKMGLEEILYLRFAEHDARAGLEPELRRVRADHDGRGLRRRGPRPLLRPGRRAARRRRQPPHAGRRHDGDGAARRRRPGRRSRTRRSPLFRAIARPTPRTTCAASTTATSRSTASPPDSTTETYAALRLDIDNWRWSGVPSSSAPASGCRSPRPRSGSSSSTRRASASRPSTADPDPNQLVIKLDPVDRRPDRPRRPPGRRGQGGADPARRASSPRWAARARHPTRCCCTPRWSATATRFTRQDGVEQTWRIMQPLLDAPPPVHAYAPGSWGPGGGRHARRRSRPLARAVDRVMSDARRSRAATQSAAAPSPFTPIADYAFLSDCHTGALVAPDGAIDWLCVPALRLAERVRQPARPRGRVVPASAPFGINHPAARAYEPGTNVLVTTWKTPVRLDRRARRADDGPAGPRGRGHAAHASAGRRRRRAHARAHGRVHRRPGRGRARLRAGVRLRPRGGGVDARRRRPSHGGRDRRRA